MSLNVRQTSANATIVATGTAGDVCVYSSTNTHVIVDAMGSYGPTGLTRWAYINFAAGQRIANTVQVRLDADRRICLYTSVSTFFILDDSATFYVTR